MKAPGEGMKEILETGRFPGFKIESPHPYVVDIQSPRGWGVEATKDGKGFSKHYNKLGQPVYRNNRDATEAIKKAQDHGDRVEARHSRDL